MIPGININTNLLLVHVGPLLLPGIKHKPIFWYLLVHSYYLVLNTNLFMVFTGVGAPFLPAITESTSPKTNRMTNIRDMTL